MSFNKNYKRRIHAGIFFAIQKLIKKVTTKTQGWVLHSLEENERGPHEQCVRFLVIKAW